MLLPKIIFRNTVLLVLMISMLLACCGIPQMIQERLTDSVNDERSSLRDEEETIPEQIDLSQRFPSQAVQAAAKELYDSLEVDNGDPSDVIRRIATALDIYQSPDRDKDTIIAQIEDGQPVLLEDHILAMASAYQAGILVSLDSFIVSLQEWGVVGKAPPGILTIEHFSNGFAGLPTQDEYAHGELWPAFVLHLGLERATREDKQIDPIWGDGMLDPLQFTLFSFTVFLAASTEDNVSHWDGRNPLRQVGAISSFLPAYLLTGAIDTHLLASNPMIEPGIDIITTNWEDWLNEPFNKAIADAIANFIGSMVGLPFTKSEAIKASICASVILYSHKLTLRTDHFTINRRWPENPPGSDPYQAQLTANLNFDFIPHNDLSRDIVNYACGSPIPQTGPVSSKPLEWSIDGDLPIHGNLNVKDHDSGPGGDAHATYQTFDEKVPRLLRKGLSEVAHGQVSVRVSQLLPDKWRSIEYFVRETRHIGLGAVYLAVRHYELPQMQLKLDITVKYLAPADLTTVLYRGHFISTVGLELDEEGNIYRGSKELFYNSYEEHPALHSNCTYTQQLTDGEIEVFLIVDPSDPDLQLFFHATEIPLVEETLFCPNPDREISRETDMWTDFLLLSLMEDIGAFGIQARGPWEESDDFRVIGRNHYVVEAYEILRIEVKLDLLRQ